MPAASSYNRKKEKKRVPISFLGRAHELVEFQKRKGVVEGTCSLYRNRTKEKKIPAQNATFQNWRRAIKGKDEVRKK
jgi:hypothetical protein